MKFYETHLEEYIHETERVNLHPKLEKCMENIPNTIQSLKNVIFYGPSGTGKYTQSLRFIKKFSPSELKYERKMCVNFNKQNFFFKVSDIHYEIDMSLLGCNSKLFWHEIYQQIVDIVSTKQNKYGIVLCKYFHETHSELLDNFYSYMQTNYVNNIHLIYILITEELSFIPDNILNCCEIISIPRPCKKSYAKCLKTKFNHFIKPNTISNIKILHNDNQIPVLNHAVICNKIVHHLIEINSISFLKFRDIIYDLFIYNLNISECIWYILNELENKQFIRKEDLTIILIKTHQFFQYYNNNYRPIYHVENYLFNLAKIIHSL
jgi:hypothetical protein